MPGSGVGDRVAVLVDVFVAVLAGVGVAEDVTVGVNVLVLVYVGLAVFVLLGVRVGLAVIVLVGVFVKVGVFVIVGVIVLVAVRVGVRVMVEVAVFVGVRVMVEVAVFVGDLVGVGLDRTENNSSGLIFTEDCRYAPIPVIIPTPPGAVTLVESVAARAGIAGQAKAMEIAIPATDWIILRNILILPINPYLLRIQARMKIVSIWYVLLFVCNYIKVTTRPISFFQPGVFWTGYPQLGTHL